MPQPTSAQRSLRTLLSAYAVSQFGNWLFRTGVVYYAYNQEHGSSAVLTTAIVLVYLPILFGSRLLAPLADRRDTRRTLIELDVLRASVLVVLLVVVELSTGFTAAATIAMMAFLSLLTPFFTASQTAYLRRVLPSERMPSALASMSRVDWSMFVLGTATAPLMLQVTDLPTLISLDIVSFIVSALLLVRLVPAPRLSIQRATDSTGRAARHRLHPASTWLLVGVFALNLGAGIINVYPNVVARNFLGGGASWLSVINLGNGIGAVVGATLAGRLKARRGLLPGILAALVVALSLVGMTFVTPAWAAVLASSLMLAAGQVFAVVFQSRILSNEPVGEAGRVSGLFTLGTFAGVTTSILLFMVVTSFGTMRSSFTLVLVIAAGAALVSAGIGLETRRRHGDQATVDTAMDGHASVPDLDVQAEALLVRQAGRAFATGVVIASTVSTQVPHATTVNSFVTISLDPPLVMISVECGSRLDTLLTERAPLGLTILSAQQGDTAKQFARSGRPTGTDQFDGHPWRPGRYTGAPLLTTGLAWLECEVCSIQPAGDHSIVLARVLSFTPSDAASDEPLVFFGGRFHALGAEPTNPAQADTVPRAMPVGPRRTGSADG